MKVLVQHTRAAPGDWEQIDAADWPLVAKKLEPVGGEVIDETPGWIFGLNVQGVEFIGDHYAVIDRVDGGCEVFCWHDDLGDGPASKFYAHHWVFLPLAPDPTRGGAINTRQSSTIYAAPGAIGRFRSNPTRTVRPWSEFNPPDESITRHGIWVANSLSAAHVSARAIRGWRDWGDHLNRDEIDAAGRVKVQRDLGRWRKAAGTITYICRDTDRDGPDTEEHEDALELTTATLGQETATVPQEATAYGSWGFSGPTNEPNSADWPNGTFTVQWDIASIGSDVAITRGRFFRANSSLATIQTGTDDTDITATGLQTHSITKDFSAGNASDRYRVDNRCSNSNTHMDETITLDLNTSDSFADGPWPAPPSADDLATKQVDLGGDGMLRITGG